MNATPILALDVTEHLADPSKGRLALSAAVLTLGFPNLATLPSAAEMGLLVRQILAAPRRRYAPLIEVSTFTGKSGGKVQVVFIHATARDDRGLELSSGIAILSPWEWSLSGGNVQLDVRTTAKGWLQ